MKTVGIIGGLGPETTSKFYLELISLCQKRNDVGRPPVLIFSAPLTYEQERNEILNGVCTEDVKQLLIAAAKRLERGGADFLVMPCNSLHVFIDDIRDSVAIPVLSIVEETVEFLKNEDVSRIGILSTLVTRNNKLFDYHLANQNIKSIAPAGADQQHLNSIILKLIRNDYTNEDRDKFMGIIDNLTKRGVENLLLACTDFQLLGASSPRVKIYDTLEILTRATVKKMLKN